MCFAPAIRGSTETDSNGRFAVRNLPPDTYTVCVDPPDGSRLLPSCDWPSSDGASRFIKLGEDEDRTGIQIILRSGTLVVITVRDPANAIAVTHFLVSVMVGDGSFYRAAFDENRRAYTRMIPKGITARLFFDTPLVVEDAEGDSLPIVTPVHRFTTEAGEAPLSVTVVPALVNAASYMPGVTQGTIATLFGTGFAQTSGTHVASGFPLPTQLAGISIKVNGIAAPLLAVIEQDGLSQINFQVPRSPAGAYEQQLAVVVVNDAKERTFYVRDWPSQLGVFSSIAHLNGESVTAINPARPGEQVTVYWTGLGGHNFVYSDGVFYVPDGIAAPPATPCVSYFDPRVQIGGVAADVGSCTAAPGLAGIGQVVVTVPPGLPSGDYDMALTLAGVKGNIVKLPVRVP